LKFIAGILLVTLSLSAFAQSVRENVVQKVALPIVQEPVAEKPAPRSVVAPREVVVKPVNAVLKR